MPWYKSGTVSVTQNSNVVIGAGTAFISNGRVGDAFRGPDGGWYEVTNIASDTALAISPNYQGATNVSGIYALAPMQGYVKDSADALRGLVNQYGAKLAALGTTGNYDVLPVNKGGTSATDAAGARSNLGAAKSGANSDITSLGGLTTALSVAQGGTGGNTQALARSGLGLGTAATAIVGTAAGNVMAVGAGGWLGASAVDTSANNQRATGLYSFYNSPALPYSLVQMFSSDWGQDSRNQCQLLMGVSTSRLWYRTITKDQLGYTPPVEFYSTGNTTKGSGGVLSAASPILRIASVSESQRGDLLEDTFQEAGAWGVTNDEARGVSVERVDVGVYVVRGSLGLSVEGWRIQDPKTPNGGQELGVTRSEQDAEGVVTIKLFTQRWTLSDEGEMIPGQGAAIDVPLNSWIDVRLEMPKPEDPPLSDTPLIEE